MILATIFLWRTDLQTTEQALFKNLPEKMNSGKSEFKFQTNAIDKWFDALPLANIRVATKAIYKTLKETNQQIVAYKKRLYFLEKIHEPVVELAANLKKLNLNRELPLSEKHSRIAILVQKLHQQISTGYTHILKDLMNCPIFFLCLGKKPLMALVIERIIRHNSLSVIANYQFYSPSGKGQWSDIHQLFLLAHKEKLLNKKVSDPSLLLVNETTIKKTYLQILLVAIADPYRMTQHHTNSIFKQMEEWSALADIYPHQNSADKDVLVIDLSTDSQPSFIAPQDVADKQATWTVDTSKLDYAHLIEHFNGPETQTTEINVDLLKQLSLSWGIAPSRQHSRRPAKAQLKVAIGLNNVHFVLNGYAEPDWIKANEFDESNNLVLTENSLPNSFNSRTIESTVKVNDVWGEIFQGGSFSSALKNNNGENKSSRKKLDHKQPHDWIMINESIGGYCLLWDNNDSINAKVGEIIAISHETGNKEGYWFVGTIRWLKCVTTNKVQIGVQIIAPNAIAVSTAKFVSMNEGMKSRAIMLPAIPILKQPKTLITTALGYETSDQVMLDEYRLINSNITSVKTKIVLLETLEISSHFSRFKYSLAEDFYSTTTKSAPDKTANDTLSLDSDSDFDSIWDDL